MHGAVSLTTTCAALQVCKITCCGITNFEQHCSSKKHLRKAAIEAQQFAGVPRGDSDDRSGANTYLGLASQCRNYCKQVGLGSTRLLYWGLVA